MIPITPVLPGVEVFHHRPSWFANPPLATGPRGPRPSGRAAGVRAPGDAGPLSPAAAQPEPSPPAGTAALTGRHRVSLLWGAPGLAGEDNRLLLTLRPTRFGHREGAAGLRRLLAPRRPPTLATAGPRALNVPFPLSQRTRCQRPQDPATPCVFVWGFKRAEIKNAKRTKFRVWLGLVFLFPLKFLKEKKRSDRIDPGQEEPAASGLPVQPPPATIARFSV